jgi:STE24 endopeptidase
VRSLGHPGQTTVLASRGDAALERSGHFAAWRAASAAPAMAGSLLLLVVLLGWMGEWEGPALLAWVASGAVVFTRVGERFAVAGACGFRRPTRAQAAALGPVWASALVLAGVQRDDVDLYVQRSPAMNAYAVGGRSIAVTTGVLREFVARRLSSDQMTGMLVHEVGHHATGVTRFGLVVMWLAAPWRAASRFVLGASTSLLGRRQPTGLLTLVVVAVVVIAVIQTGQQGQWAAAGLLAAVGVCAVVCPLVEAAVSRRSEYAADRFTLEHGAGAQLGYALRALDCGWRPGLRTRALSRHPSTAQRFAALGRGAG